METATNHSTERANAVPINTQVAAEDMRAVKGDRHESPDRPASNRFGHPFAFRLSATSEHG